MGAIYIPPEGYPYSSAGIFNKLEQDIMNVCAFTFLMRGLLSDFITIDEDIGDFALDFESKLILNEIGYPIDDTLQKFQTQHNYGYRLWELCKSLGIHGVNGRCGAHSYIGG